MKYQNKENVSRLGVLDYLNFQLNRMNNAITFLSWSNVFKDNTALMLIIPAFVIFAVANIVHYALAISFTVVASPVVAVIHIFSQILDGSFLKNDAGKPYGIVHKEYNINKEMDNTLNGFLNELSILIATI